MPDYTMLKLRVRAMPVGSLYWQPIVEDLSDLWLGEYTGSDSIVETRNTGFSYLFDIEEGRLIAAWGISQGRSSEVRDKNRMAGHPLGAGPEYHRGHTIPHTLGGGTDINLVPQLGSINVGAFRPLEKQAVATPGAFYFTYWKYGLAGNQSQIPVGVDQGLLIAGTSATIRDHGN